MVYCGNYVKFGFLVANPKKKKGNGEMDLIIEKVDGQILQDMHAKFDSHVEVIKVIETVN